MIGAAARPAHGGSAIRRPLLRNRTLVALCADVRGHDLRLVLLSDVASDVPARGARIRHQAHGLVLGAAAGRDRARRFLGGVLSDDLPRSVRQANGRRIQGLVGLPVSRARRDVAVATRTPIVVGALLLAAPPMFAALGVAPAWTVCVDIGGPHAGRRSGAMNMFGNLGGALVSLVVGFCHSWNPPLYSIAAFYLLAAGAWLLVDPEQMVVAEPASILAA